MTFKSLGLHATLVHACKDMNYVEPTPVQAKAIPAVLARHDLIATAQTGTGKTAAFLLPLLHQLLELPRGKTQALIVTPTRELARQIDEVLLGLAYHTNLRGGLIVGGSPMMPQEKTLRAGVELLIATPGRLLDHMRLNQARFDPVHYSRSRRSRPHVRHGLLAGPQAHHRPSARPASRRCCSRRRCRRSSPAWRREILRSR